jgi:hypothetical protein
MSKAAAETTEAPAENQDGPLLDLTDQTVKAMIKTAKKRGYVTHDELNKVLPSEEFSSEQIEDILAQLSEMGITVVDSEEDADTDDGEATAKRKPAKTTARPKPSLKRREPPRSRGKTPPRRRTAPMTRCACICAKWARWSCCRAKAKSRSPSASKPAATP